MSKVYVAKLVIETQSPMAITTGERETGFDAALVRDVNGLPMIPATAIAGVWGQLTQQILGDKVHQYWFGTNEQASRLTISQGVLHDQYNCPVQVFMSPAQIEQDAVLSVCALSRPYHRERVSINDRGVAKQTGKYDQIVLPKGARFNLTVHWQDDHTGMAEPHDDHLAVLALWHRRDMALGSSTRNGLGHINLIASEILAFDLTRGGEQAKKLNTFMFNRHVPVEQQIQPAKCDNATLFASLPLRALDNWRCGTGAGPMNGEATSQHAIAMTTYTEPCWQWNAGKAVWIAAKPVLCGSSIKGMLAHRVAYHYRKNTGQWAECFEDKPHEVWEEKPHGIGELFGRIDPIVHEKSMAGLLLIDDCEVSYEHTTIRHHNTLDRFTGGVRKGALFTEELLYKPTFTLTIWLTEKNKKRINAVSRDCLAALLTTLDELKRGMLPLGAGSGRGVSLVEADDTGSWVINQSLLMPSVSLATKEAQ